MGLRLKFNLILFLVFLVGFGVTGWVSHELLQRNARVRLVPLYKLVSGVE